MTWELAGFYRHSLLIREGLLPAKKVFWVVSVSELRASCVVFGTAFSVFQMGFVWSLCIYTQGQKTYNYTRNNINTARPFFLYLQRRVRMQRLTTAAGLFLCLSKKSAAAWLDNLNCNSTKCRPSHQNEIACDTIDLDKRSGIDGGELRLE